MNKKWGTWKDFFYLGRPHRVLLGFNPPVSLLFLNPKGTGFWIERLIINSGELGFRGTRFHTHHSSTGKRTENNKERVPALFRAHILVKNDG